MIPAYRSSVYALAGSLTMRSEPRWTRREATHALAFRLSVIGVAAAAALMLLLFG